MWFLILLAIAIGIWARLAVAKTNSGLEDLKYDLYGAKNKSDELARRYDALAKKLNNLIMEQRHRDGDLRFTADMTLAQILNSHPNAAEVLAEYNLGGCSMCASVESETLAQAALVHGFELDQLLAALNALE